MRHTIERLADRLVSKLVPNTTAGASCIPDCWQDTCCGCNGCPWGTTAVYCINGWCNVRQTGCASYWQCF